MIIALALVFSVNANAKTNWIMKNSYFMDCEQILFNGIGEDGRKTLEAWDCEHQQNFQRKKRICEWPPNSSNQTCKYINPNIIY